MSQSAGQPTISVVVVSRRRPEALKRALVGISQLRYPAFEVVVVADAAGVSAAKNLPFGDQLKTVEFETPNISAARNRGIAHAAGEVVAFVDDDAVPETGWLHHLAAPFAKPEVAAAGGYVRGRNGISFQWQAQSVDGAGDGLPLGLSGEEPVVLTPSNGRAIKTEGTNMAFRREVLAEMGGFDPAFQYYLDETDLNIRLAAAGHKTAIVPQAEVHHGYAENRQRTAERVPRDLSEIGASKAVFLRKHCAEEQREAVWKAFCLEQRRRLLRHMVSGHIMPGDVRRLMRGLQQGYVDGLTRPFGQMPELTRASEVFAPLDIPAGPQVMIYGRYWRRKAMLREAKQAAKEGKLPSVFIFSHTGLFHSVRFDPAGFWLQRGGLFGRSDRRQSLLRIRSFGARLRQEFQRVAAQRLLSEILLPERLRSKKKAQK